MKASVILLLIFITACNNIPHTTFETPKLEGGATPMKLIQNIPLQGVEGRIDHLSIDINGQRLFVAALGNNTVEVIDLNTGKVVHSISDLSEPQSALFVPSLNKIFVTNGGNGICQIFDGTSFAELGGVQLSGDADNIRYDSNSTSVIVGYGDGGLSFIDGNSAKEVSNVKLDGHPESFQFEPSGARIFVNIPASNQIAVVDRKQGKVVSTWFMTSALANFPMALDETQHRLFVGFRVPAKLIVFNTETGKSVAGFDSVGNVDDVFYDAAHKLIFVIGGEGFIEIFSQQAADHYQSLGRISTADGARTGLWVAESNRLYIAVPHKGKQEAEIQVYELQP